MKYLGSTVIKELRGTESTKKSIQKLKKSEKIMGVNAMTTVGLTNSSQHNTKRAVNIMISHRGVQFVDPEMQVSEPGVPVAHQHDTVPVDSTSSCALSEYNL